MEGLDRKINDEVTGRNRPCENDKKAQTSANGARGHDLYYIHTSEDSFYWEQLGSFTADPDTFARTLGDENLMEWFISIETHLCTTHSHHKRQRRAY